MESKHNLKWKSEWKQVHAEAEAQKMHTYPPHDDMFDFIAAKMKVCL